MPFSYLHTIFEKHYNECLPYINKCLGFGLWYENALHFTSPKRQYKEYDVERVENEETRTARSKTQKWIETKLHTDSQWVSKNGFCEYGKREWVKAHKSRRVSKTGGERVLSTIHFTRTKHEQ